MKGDALLVVKQVLDVWKSKNMTLKERCLKIKGLLKNFEAWSIKHTKRALNEEAHEAAQGMIGEVFVMKADQTFYCGLETLAKEEDFLLRGIIPQEIEKPRKYGFLHRASHYKLISDTLYMKGSDLVLQGS